MLLDCPIPLLEDSIQQFSPESYVTSHKGLRMVLLQDLSEHLQIVDPEERHIISSVSWEQYEAVLADLEDNPVYHVTFLDGGMERGDVVHCALFIDSWRAAAAPEFLPANQDVAAVRRFEHSRIAEHPVTDAFGL